MVSQNNIIYQDGAFPIENFNGSFLRYFLREVETVHAKVRRYTSPDEYPFSRNLPSPVLPPLPHPQMLIPNDINYNEKLVEIYTKDIVPLICKAGDDEHYGSAATKDVEALQLLSRRVHFGKFVAEAKFTDPKEHDEYVRLIKAQDRDGIMKLLTNQAVEDRLLRRLKRKALVYGQEIDDDSPLPEGATAKGEGVKGSQSHLRIPLDVVAKMYEKFVIPLTKEVEVDYLLRRLEYPDFVPGIVVGDGQR
ncbi:chorismate mutase aro7 [Rhizophlyctis rosea]|uniref:Chorismate mutase n=1 Tax=Rhizophlyctis rosea TaxID=64517 RepID=A0AAD5X3X5_9FUNG|nr:chorismate mutase aro7 [Rhizophlyctis rosea]